MREFKREWTETKTIFAWVIFLKNQHHKTKFWLIDWIFLKWEKKVGDHSGDLETIGAIWENWTIWIKYYLHWYGLWCWR